MQKTITQYSLVSQTLKSWYFVHAVMCVLCYRWHKKQALLQCRDLNCQKNSSCLHKDSINHGKKSLYIQQNKPIPQPVFL